MIPFLDLKKVNEPLIEEIGDAVRRVAVSGWYIMGKECASFEQEMAEDLSSGTDAGYVVGCNSGTDAIALALLAAGVNRGDEVITVSHTAIPTAAAIVSVGAVPVFVDIDPLTWVMDISKVRQALTPKTKAVVPVHLYGNMVDIYALRVLLQEVGRADVAIVEDCAQAQGSILNEKQAGTIGDFGAYSFYPSKNIGALGDGGAVFTCNKAAKEQLLMYRNYGQRDRYHALVSGGINSRLDEMQAAVLRVKLRHLHDWNAHKRVLMKKYREELRDLPLTFQMTTEGCKPGWHLCVAAFEKGVSQDEMQQTMREHGVETLIHYPLPVHMQEAFLDYSRKELPVTEDLAKRIVSLPFSYAMNEQNVHEICHCICSCFSNVRHQ